MSRKAQKKICHALQDKDLKDIVRQGKFIQRQDLEGNKETPITFVMRHKSHGWYIFTVNISSTEH